MSTATQTTDHTEIKRWIEERGGHPARVKGAGEGGILRVDFGEPEPNLEQMDWDEFFTVFDENELAFLHQDKVDGGATSRFNKFVSRNGNH